MARPRQRTFQDANEIALFDTGAYAYDGAGNISAIGSDAYTYDGTGRLRSATLNASELSAARARALEFRVKRRSHLTL